MQQLIESIFEDLTGKHKADVRWFSGQEPKENPANDEVYPALVYVPATIEDVADGEDFDFQQISVSFLCVDALSSGHTNDEMNNIRHKCTGIASDIINKFKADHVYVDTSTFDGQELPGLDQVSNPVYTPIITQGRSNFTGVDVTVVFKSIQPINCSTVDSNFN